MNYKISHLGGANFKAIFEDGTEKEVGENLRGMIKYTYFDDTDELPEMNWSCEFTNLFSDYHNKLAKDINSGKFQNDITDGKIKIS